MEKHWKAVISRSVCDYFFDAQKKSPNSIPSPVIATPHHYLISIRRCNVFLVAVCMSEGGHNKNSDMNSDSDGGGLHVYVLPPPPLDRPKKPH